MAENKTEEKVYNIGDLLNASEIGYLPNVFRCPHCYNYNFRILADKKYVVCIRCHKVALVYDINPITKAEIEEIVAKRKELEAKEEEINELYRLKESGKLEKQNEIIAKMIRTKAPKKDQKDQQS